MSEKIVGLCRECRREFRVKQDGTMRWHADGNGSFATAYPKACPGVGKEPHDGTGLDEEAVTP